LNLKKLYKITLVVVLFLITYQISFAQSSEKKAIKVLFVGNSFTYFFNLPQVVSSMAESQGVEIITRQSTVGGSTLEEHWKELKGTKTRRLLDSTTWDYVVLNNHSTITVNAPDKFMDYTTKFIELVRSKGAEPIVMQTWGYKSNPLLIRPIIDGYSNLAQSTKSAFVPAGELFMEARKWRPDLELFQDDKHPSSNGTYMLGLAFFKFFTGLSTTEIPFRITTTDKDGEKLYLIFMSTEDADFLKQLVDDFEFRTAKQ
jgi:hypothetical protein